MINKYSFSSKRTGKFRKSPMTNKHSIPYSQLVLEVINTSDIVLEVLDVRFIEKTRNLEMEKAARDKGKIIIFVLNKSDLIKVHELKQEFDLTTLEPYVFFSCTSKIGRSRLREKIKYEVKKLKLSERARVGVVGYPNTGKSSLINVLTRKKGTGTSPQPGFTKAIQKIRFTDDIVILDTPGVFPEREDPFTNSTILKKHAEIGTNTYNEVREPEMVVAEIMKQHPGRLEKFYKIEAEGDSELLVEKIGMTKKFLKKGNLIDTKRAAKFILKDWQSGKIN